MQKPFFLYMSSHTLSSSNLMLTRLPFLVQSKNMILILFGAQSWVLWTTGNKFSTETIFPRQPADCVFKTGLFMHMQQQCPLLKKNEGLLADTIIAALRHLYGATHQPSTA
jgi:hypothetical protein